jgi:hypothetical protein
LRGQIELWMLTKMAMLFFIVALALVMTGFGTQEKKTVCAAQAQAVARSIGGAITQVVNAPAEDERKVFPLEPVLSVGQVEFSRYTLFLVDHVDEQAKRKFVSITVQGRDRDCVGTDSAAYPYSMVGGLQSDSPGGPLLSAQVPPVRGFFLEGAVCECRDGSLQGEGCRLAGTACTGGDWILQVLPSQFGGEGQRAYYLVALKCQEKQITPGVGAVRHLFLEACTNPQPGECIDFTSGNLRQACDWPVVGG